MKPLLFIFCISLYMLAGCASSEPAPKQDVNVDEIRANAAQAYEELDAK